MKTTILSRITAAFKATKSMLSLSDLYSAIDAKKHSIRARIYMNGDKFQRVGKGLYILKDGTCVHRGIKGNALDILPQLKAEGVSPDFVVFDLPFSCSGQKGGNRDLAAFPVISPEQCGEICKEVSEMVDDRTPVLFIFTEGKTSNSLRKKFILEIEKVFSLATEGDYIKTYKNGAPCQFMGRTMPVESLMIYTKSGEFDATEIDLDIEAIRPGRGSYPTEKPVSLLTSIFNQFLKAGNMILDPFAGSGSSGKAASALGLHSILIDILHNPLSKI